MLVANAPGWLLGELRQTNAAQQLAQSASPDDLREWMDEHSESLVEDVPTFVRAHVVLAALSLMDSDEAKRVLRYIATMPIRWFPELVRIALTPRPTTTVSGSAKLNASIASSLASSNTSSTAIGIVST